MAERALHKAGGRVEEAAKLLGIRCQGVFLKRRRWGLGVSAEGIETLSPPWSCPAPLTHVLLAVRFAGLPVQRGRVQHLAKCSRFFAPIIHALSAGLTSCDTSRSARR